MTENNKNSTNTFALEETSRHPWWRFASNGTFQFVVTLNSAVQGIYIGIFYVQYLGLAWNYVFLCLTIFTIFDAINDPILGWLVDRNFRWTRKWGRRFIWVAISILPWCGSLYLIFTAPEVTGGNPWPTFFWLLGGLLIYDTFGSLIGVNLGALRQDLFRTDKERRKFTYWFTYIDILAQAVGFILPPILLMATGESHALMAAISAGLCLIGALLFLPSTWEDKIMIDRYYDEQGNERSKPEFFKHLIAAFKQRSFIIAFIMLTAFNVGIGMLLTMNPYLSTFVWGKPGGDFLIYPIFFTGVIVSIPIWMLYMRKKGLKKAVVLGGLLLSFAYAFLTVSPVEIYLYIVFFFMGAALGSTWAFLWTVMMLDVTDDYVVRTKTGYKGVMVGIFALLTRLVATIDDGIITLVQNYTNFPEGITTLGELEAVASVLEQLGLGDLATMQLGIRFMIGVIPAVILFLGTIVFWVFYPLTPEKVAQNKGKLQELKL